MNRYVLYEDGLLSVITPLRKLNPSLIIPLTRTPTQEDEAVEFQLPNAEIDPDQVQLLSSKLEPITPQSQTYSLGQGITKMRFVPTSLKPKGIPNLLVQYVDNNPSLAWRAVYEAQVNDGSDDTQKLTKPVTSNPNSVKFTVLTCFIHLVNKSDRVLGPGKFQILLRTNQSQPSRPRGARELERKGARVMSKKRMAPMLQMAQMASMASMQQQSSEESLPVPTSSPFSGRDTHPVTEGSLISLPILEKTKLEKMSSIKLPIAAAQDISVKKYHCFILSEATTKGLAALEYHFRSPFTDMLPGGELSLYSDTRQNLQNFDLDRMVPKQMIRLQGGHDVNVLVQASLQVRQVKVDKQGNEVIVYTGGCTVRNLYKRELQDMHVFLPVDKPHVVVKGVDSKNSSSSIDTHFNPTKSRVEFRFNVAAQSECIFSFTIFASDAIRVNRPVTTVELE